MDNILDDKLIRMLQEDGRQSSNVLAKKLGVSSATVRRRIKKLVQSGLLKIVGLVDPDKAGLPFVAIIAVDVVHDKLSEAVKAITAYPEVIWIAATTGRYDIIALAHFAESEQFSNFLREELGRIEGVRDSETFLCLQVAKGRYQYLY
ncbi:Lrp/AsnC family transcriptional regulator [Chloroflexota bacterium]